MAVTRELPGMAKRNLISNAMGLLFLVLILGVALAGALRPEIPFGLADYDTELHFALYAALALAAAQFGWGSLATLSVVFAISTVLELAQLQIPDRTFSGWDMVSNFAGALFGAAAARIGQIFLKKRRSAGSAH